MTTEGEAKEEWKRGKQEAKEGIREGVRAVTGFLAALKDAIDETLRDVRDSGDLDPDKAKDAMRSTMRKAQDAMDDVKDRLDFAQRKDIDALREELAAIRVRLTDLENKAGGGPASIPIDGA